jgi:hypothetical protein
VNIPSQNTQSLIELLVRRDEKGLAKYGVSLDRTDMSPGLWMQHAIEELLDGAAYLQGLKRTMGEVREVLLSAKCDIEQHSKDYHHVTSDELLRRINECLEKIA